VRATGGYARQKFPGLEPREVAALVERYRALTGRFATVTVRAVHRSTVTMEME
jgi:hypothetical protein